jgi:hypothetical protein
LFNRRRCVDRPVIGEAKFDGFGASTAIGAYCQLCLRMKVADRAVVDRGILVIALPRRRASFRSERGRTMTEAGKRVQRRAAQGNHTVERQDQGQQKLIRAPGSQELKPSEPQVQYT